MKIINLSIHASNLQKGKFHNSNYYIFPATIMTPGVRNGVLWEAKELKKSTQTWAGIPIILDHVYDTRGNPVSANEVDILEDVQIGYFFNPEWDGTDKRVFGEFWLEQEAIESIPDLFERIESGELIELSVAYFPYEVVEQAGVFEDQRYKYIDRGMIPDHIAILPEATGACSVEDGCGFPRAASLFKAVKAFIKSEDTNMLRNNKKDEKKRAEIISVISGFSEKDEEKLIEEFKDVSLSCLEMFADELKAKNEAEEKLAEFQEGKNKDGDDSDDGSKSSDFSDEDLTVYVKSLMEELPLSAVKDILSAHKEQSKKVDEEKTNIEKKLINDFKMNEKVVQGMNLQAMKLQLEEFQSEIRNGVDFSPRSFNGKSNTNKAPAHIPTYGAPGKE